MARPYLRNDHLETVLSSDAGAIRLTPLRADDIHFDAAWSNAYPANEASSRNGSSVLTIGRGVQVRATGNVRLVDGTWAVSHLTAKQYPSGRELTRAQVERTQELLADVIGAWAVSHAGDIAQADDVDRNNGARTLEEQVERHEAAIAILRAQLEACEQGEPFSMYPVLPTDR